MLFIVFWYCEFFNCQFYDMILTPSINKNEIVGWNNFRGRNMLTMCEEGIQPLLDSTEVVVIMKKWGSINRAYIDKMVKMSHRNSISVDLANEISIRKVGRKKQDQRSNYTIINNGAYYVHYDWYKIQKRNNRVAILCTIYSHDECNLKLIMKMFIYKI